MYCTQRAEAHAAAQFSVFEIIELAGMNSGRNHHQGFSCDRIEVGAKVHRAVDRDDFLFGGFETDVTDHRQVQALRSRTTKDAAHFGIFIVDTQQRHVARDHMKFLVGRFGFFVIEEAAGLLGVDPGKAHATRSARDPRPDRALGQALQVDGDVCFAALAVPGDLAIDANETVHPVLLDSAFQAAMAMALAPARLMVPQSIGALHWKRPIGRTATLRANLVSRSTFEMTADLTLFDEGGQVALSIERAQFRHPVHGARANREAALSGLLKDDLLSHNACQALEMMKGSKAARGALVNGLNGASDKVLLHVIYSLGEHRETAAVKGMEDNG